LRQAAALVAAALWIAWPALAANPDAQANKRWKQADACVADATKKVPDHNEAALRKRDQLVNDCMVAHKLPPLTDLAPASPAPASPPSN
jgi:hypothetical protein